MKFLICATILLAVIGSGTVVKAAPDVQSQFLGQTITCAKNIVENQLGGVVGLELAARILHLALTESQDSDSLLAIAQECSRESGKLMPKFITETEIASVQGQISTLEPEVVQMIKDFIQPIVVCREGYLDGTFVFGGGGSIKKPHRRFFQVSKVSS